MTWDDAVALALGFPDTELSTSYGQPAVKANGNAFLNMGHEPDTSFVLRLDHGVIEWLMTEYPDTFWKTAHYVGYPAVLVRFDTGRDGLVGEMIASACDRAKAKKPPRERKR